MYKSVLAIMLLLSAVSDAVCEDSTSEADGPSTKQAGERQDPAQPRTMSGMSILGNEEAPKALVIVPWKSSELGADLSMSDSLDDRARPVDKEVFVRELSFYEIRAKE